MAEDSQGARMQQGVATEALAGRGITVRSVFLAAGVSAAVSVVVGYIEYDVRGSELTRSHFPMGALMVYLLVVLALNPLIRLLARRYALSDTEQLAILAGALVGGAVPGVGLTGYFLGVIAAPYYFATPENQWGEFFHLHIPTWLAPRNVNRSIDYLYEGLPTGVSIPWSVWLVPVACWMALATALFVGSICLAVILRKQWAESERLTYPVLRPVLDLTVREGTGLPRLFWVGFCIASGIICWNMINYFVPSFPIIPNIRWGPWVWFDGGFEGRWIPGIWTRINMFTISFAYFANIDVLFSFWFFGVLFIARSGILNRFGFNASTPWNTSREFSWLNLGAFFMLVFWGLWTARRHLKAVVRKALDGDASLDDAEEMMGYRTALLGLGLSMVFAVFWLWRAGMGFGVACLYLFATLVIYLGVARIVSDVGLVFVCTPVGAQEMVTRMLGPRNLAASTHTALAFSNGLTSYGKGLFMPAVTHAAKIADTCPGPDRRRLLVTVLLAFAAGAAASIVYTLYAGYTLGAYNFKYYHPFRSYSKGGFITALAQMRNPEPIDPLRLSLFGIGLGVMALLTFLKYRFSWWPLHPIGFPIAGVSYVYWTTFSVFIAWAIKFVLLQVGGATLYRRYRPFFLGVLTGYTLGVSLSVLVDVIWFPGAGHYVHGY